MKSDLGLILEYDREFRLLLEACKEIQDVLWGDSLLTPENRDDFDKAISRARVFYEAEGED